MTSVKACLKSPRRYTVPRIGCGVSFLSPCFEPARRAAPTPVVSSRISIGVVASMVATLALLCPLHAQLPAVRSRRRRLVRLSILESRKWGLSKVSDRWRLSGINDGCGWCPGVIPCGIDILLAIGRQQQYRKDRAKQHCHGCQDSGTSDPS